VRQFFDFAALFVVHGDLAEGRDAYGEGASRERVMAIGVPLDLPSVLATARQRGEPILVRPSGDGLDQVMLSDLQRAGGAPVLIVPIVVRKRVVGLLYGDSGGHELDNEGRKTVFSFAHQAGQAFEKLIMRKKIGGFKASASGPPARVDAEKVPSKRLGATGDGPNTVASPQQVFGALASLSSSGAQALQAPPVSPRAASAPPPTRAETPDAKLHQAPTRAETPLAKLHEARVAAGLSEPKPDPSPLAPSPDPEPIPELPGDNEPTEPMKLPARVVPPLAAKAPTLVTIEHPAGLPRPDDPPPAPAVVAVRRPSAPPIPREEPEFHPLDKGWDEAPQTTVDARGSKHHEPPTDRDAGGMAGDADAAPPSGEYPQLDDREKVVVAVEEIPGAPPSEQQISVAAHHPPSSRNPLAEPLPSIIVDVDREFSELVDKLIEEGDDEQITSELLRQGQSAMPAIMRRFPGPITASPERLAPLVEGAPISTRDVPPRASECGPILRLIAGQRRVALPFVLEEVKGDDVDKRFWATLLLAELAYPDAAEPLVPRLFDDEPRIRRAARIAARAVAEVAPSPLVEHLATIVFSSDAPSARRITAIDTMGDLREPLAVPALVGVLSETEEDVAAAALRALTKVTHQDFAKDTKKWMSWWSSNAPRHRIEWLIEALMNEEPALRRAAGEELKAITKEYFGYYDDLPKRERERAQQRYRDWWTTEGRLRFRRS
jgi:hypothetical protein